MRASARFSLGLGVVLAAAAGMTCRPGTDDKPAPVAGIVEGTVAVVRTITGGRLTDWTAVEGREVAAGRDCGGPVWSVRGL